MPDIFFVNSAGVIIMQHRDRSKSFQPIYGIGHSLPVGIVYTGDYHDVQSPERIHAVKRAAAQRRQAWFDSFELCINCKLDEDAHDGYMEDWGYEPNNDNACGFYQRPKPLVMMT